MKRITALALIIVLFCFCATALADLKLPEKLQVIEPYAFYGDESLTTVTLPEGLKEIRAKAFANSSVRQINLPSSLTFIATNAFDGCEQVRISVPNNSYALVWVKARQTIPYTIAASYSSQYGSIVGNILDSEDHGVGGIEVSLHMNKKQVAETVTEEDGSYFFTDVPEGRYKLLASKNGYVEFANYVDVYGGETIYAEPANIIDSGSAQSGTVSGRITDAFSGKGMSNVTVTVRNGWGNQDTGAVVKTLTTDSNGYYSTSLPAGYYTVTANIDGYTVSSSNICAQPNQTTENQNVAVPPKANDDEYRIKLTWGVNPSDLDSHLAGTALSGSGFHVYYSSKQAYDNGRLICNLDVDDRNGEGPEVVTLLAESNQPYYYYVHHYAGEGTIATSSARIEIYKGGTPQRTYVVSPGAGEGKYWNVFAIQNGKIITRNTMTDSPETGYLSGEEPAEEDSTLTWADGTTVRDEIEVPASGYIYSFSFISEQPWSITAPAWVALSTRSGKAGKQSVTAVIKKNEEGPREGDLYISASGTNPLVVHFTQLTGGAEVLFTMTCEDTVDSEGYTQATAVIGVSDKDSNNLFQGQNISLKARLPRGEITGDLALEHIFTYIGEGVDKSLSFKLKCYPSQRQINQLIAQDEVKTEPVMFKIDIKTDNCGNYEYVKTFNSVPMSTSDETFHVFLANQIFNNSPLQYDMDTYQPPYKVMVQPLIDSPFFQDLLVLWRLTTFDITSEVEYTEKELDYYRAYLYSMLYDEGQEPFVDSMSDIYGLADTINSFYEAFSDYDTTIGQINLDIFAQGGADSPDIRNGILKFFDDILDADKKGKLNKDKYAKYLGTAKMLEKIDDVSSFISVAGTITDFLERVQNVHNLVTITEEKKALLQGIADQQPNNPALQAVVQEYLTLYANMNEAGAAAIMAGEETAFSLLKFAGDEAYGLVMKLAPWYTMAQMYGKALSDYFFNTEDIINTYYECEAVINMEDALIREIYNTYADFHLRQSDETALRFLSAVDAFYRNRYNGMKAADSFAKAALTDEASMKILVDDLQIPINIVKRALARAVGMDKTQTYESIQKILENQKTYTKGFMESQRYSAVYMYYDTTRLIEGEETLERID